MSNQHVLRFMWGMLWIGLGCGTGPTEPVYEIEETPFQTPAGTEHEMVKVPAGEFEMGSTEGFDNERPVHPVFLDAYYIDKYEVTNARYMAFVEDQRSERPQFLRDEAFNQPDQPVVGVSWQQAWDYCTWAGMKLPSEAQWEKAARGTDARIYPWGDEDPDETRTQFHESEKPAPVGSHPSGVSPYGAHDMAGNVWEWTLDEYEHTFYAKSPERNPLNLKGAGEDDGPDRTLRGGSWFSQAVDIRTTVRSTLLLMELRHIQAEIEDPFFQARIGFRCVKAIEN